MGSWRKIHFGVNTTYQACGIEPDAQHGTIRGLQRGWAAASQMSVDSWIAEDMLPRMGYGQGSRKSLQTVGLIIPGLTGWLQTADAVPSIV